MPTSGFSRRLMQMTRSLHTTRLRNPQLRRAPYVTLPCISTHFKQLRMPSSATGRHFSHTCHLRTQPPTSLVDPSRPDLFYHLILPPNPLSSIHPAFAVSFLETEPSSPTSATILGWLPATGEGEEDGAGLNDFKENRVLSLDCCLDENDWT